MAEHDQINVRVPAAAREVMKDLAERLRKDSRFVYRLKRWLEEDADNGQSALLMARVERLEAQVSDLFGVLADDEVHVGVGEDQVANLATRSTVWTTGEGKGRRLTEEGVAELRRRVEAGESDATVAAALGVRAYAVASKRRHLQIPRKG